MKTLNLQSLPGKYLESVKFKRLLNIGLECLTLNFEQGSRIGVTAAEIPLGKYETYGLLVESEDKPCGGEELPIGLCVQELLLFEREEWLVSTEKTAGIIGNDPQQLEYGEIGSAPADAGEIVRVVSGLCLTFVDSIAAIRIFVDQYPGLINFDYPDRKDDEFYRTSTLSARFPIR